MDRLLYDTLAALALLVTAILGAYAPVLLAERARARGGPSTRSLTYVLGNMLSAGVMVSAGLCHLLNDALNGMPGLSFPLAPFLAGVGYFMTLVADAIAASTAGSGARCHGAEPTRAEQGMRRAKSSDLQAVATPTALAPGPPGFVRSAAANGGSVGLAPPRMLPQDMASIEVLAARGALHDDDGEVADGFEAEGLLPAGGSSSQPGTARAAGSREGGPPRVTFDLEASAPPPVATRAPPQQPAPRVAFVTAVLMGVALCFHSVLEGAALGAQETVASSTHIFIAIISHKGLAAYALGSSVVDSGVERSRFWSVILPFTLASPAGIFLGYIVSDLAQGLGAASISALAAGTFLYVAFMEVIPKELRDSGNTAYKLIALITGYGVMSLLAIWA